MEIENISSIDLHNTTQGKPEPGHSPMLKPTDREAEPPPHIGRQAEYSLEPSFSQLSHCFNETLQRHPVVYTGHLRREIAELGSR